MDYLFQVDAGRVFSPTLSVLEIVIRAVITYFGLCLLLRIVPKRQVGRASLTDLLFIVLIGGIAVDGIARDAQSLADFFLVILAVFLLTYAFDVLSFRYRWFRRLLLEPPTCLIKDGRVLKANLRREMISEEDLMRELRRQDVESPAEVKLAELEADGEVSIVTRQARPKRVPEAARKPKEK